DDGLGQTTCGTGACQRAVNNCVNGQMQTCTPGIATAETCNGIDDDCNGTVDDGLGQTTCGTGACQRTVDNCANGQPRTCVPGSASAEVCDDLDNDCDGVVDNGNPGGGVACDTGQLGVCAAGTSACSGGTIACNRNVDPSADPPDDSFVDSNCDGIDGDAS